MKTTNTFKTGATTHAVNDLILFTDNTRELAEYRDCINKIYVDAVPQTRLLMYKELLKRSQYQYIKEFGFKNSLHIAPIDCMSMNERLKGKLTKEQEQEFCNLYAADFDNWKQEHGY